MSKMVFVSRVEAEELREYFKWVIERKKEVMEQRLLRELMDMVS